MSRLQSRGFQRLARGRQRPGLDGSSICVVTRMTPLDPPENPEAAATDHRDSLRPEVQPERRSATPSSSRPRSDRTRCPTVSKLDASLSRLHWIQQSRGTFLGGAALVLGHARAGVCVVRCETPARRFSTAACHRGWHPWLAGNRVVAIGIVRVRRVGRSLSRNALVRFGCDPTEHRRCSEVAV